MKQVSKADEASITDREGEALSRYLNELDRSKLVSAAEEKLLAEKIRQGDRAALDKLVSANLKFVVSVAKRYQGNGLSLAELIAEGNMGLLTAAERFDERKGFKFITFAVWWIRQAIVHSLSSSTRVIRLPLNIVRDAAEIRKKAELMERELERMPALWEVAQELRMEQDHPALLHSFGAAVLSYDAPIAGEDAEQEPFSSGLRDVEGLASDHLLMEESVHILAKRTLSVLDERERKILELVFGIGRERPLSMEEIGELMGLGQERVRQIHHKAIARARKLARIAGVHYQID